MESNLENKGNKHERKTRIKRQQCKFLWMGRCFLPVKNLNNPANLRHVKYR